MTFEDSARQLTYQCVGQVHLDRHGWRVSRTLDSFPKETLVMECQRPPDTTHIVVHYQNSRVVPCNDALEKMVLIGPIHSPSNQERDQLWHP